MESLSFRETKFSPELLDMLLVHLVRCTSVTQAAQGRLSVDLFDEHEERMHAMLWRLASDFYTTNKAAPTREYLEAKAAQAMDNDKAAFPGDERGAVFELIRHIFSLPEENFFPKEAIEDLQKFLIERKFKSEARTLIEESEPGMMREITNLYNTTMVKAAQASSEEPFVTPHFGTQLVRFETGVDYFDYLFGGLPHVGLGGILGPTGGGKTLMSTEVTTQTAIHYPELRTMLLSYEQPLEGDIFDRIYCAALEINREDILGKPYEELPEGLRDKYEALKELIGDRVSASSMLDYNGVCGAEEIRIMIDNYAQKKGVAPNLVFVDWLEPVARKIIQANQRLSQRDMRFVMNGFMYDMLSVVSEFKTFIFVANQLNAAACEKKPVYKPSWTDGHESKGFAHLMEVVGAIGQPDPSGVRWWHCSKNRGNPQRSIAIKMQGERCTFKMMSPEMTINAGGNEFFDPSAVGDDYNS